MRKTEPVILDSYYDAEDSYSEPSAVEIYAPRSKLNSAQLRELAQQHTEAAVNTLIRVMNDVHAPTASQVTAANAILDRGWGKPAVDGHFGSDRPPISEIKVLFGSVVTEPAKIAAKPKKIEKSETPDAPSEQ